MVEAVNQSGQTQGDPNELTSFGPLLAQARRGDFEAIGQILEQCRDYLLLIANQDLDRGLQQKIGASDLVQESMLTAQAQFERFEGDNKEQLLAWLRGVLLNDMRHWHRHYKGTRKRSVLREAHWSGSDVSPPEPSDPKFTPSTQAAADEEQAMLDEAMSLLPENYRTVIQLRNFEDRSFVDIGQQMGCTAEAARKLWSRCILRLQEILASKWPELRADLMDNEET